MSDSPLSSQPSDDALYFSNSGGTDLFTAAEDPTGRTAETRTPQFRHRQDQVLSVYDGAGPAIPIPVVRLTPGASTIP